MATAVFIGCSGGGDGGDNKTPNTVNEPKDEEINETGNPGTSTTEEPNTTSGAQPIASIEQTNAEEVAMYSLLHVKGAADGASILAGAHLLTASYAVLGAKFDGVELFGENTCTAGGQRSWAYTDADNNAEISVGDTWEEINSDCADSVATSNGTVNLEFVKWKEEGSSTVSEIAMNINQIFVTSGGDEDITMGDLTLFIENIDDNTSSRTIQTTGFQSTYEGAQVELKNFEFKKETGSDTGTESVTFNGTVDETVLGKVRVGTTATLVGTDVPLLGGTEMYSQGLFFVVKDGVKLTLTVLNATSVRLELDNNGDGEADFQLDTTWEIMTGKYLEFVNFEIPDISNLPSS